MTSIFKYKTYLREIFVLLIIFSLSILVFISDDLLNIPKPLFVYESFLVISVAYFFGAFIGSIFLLFVLSFDLINHIGLIYFHNLIDIYTNLPFFVSHIYFSYYILFQLLLCFLSYMFFFLVKKIETRRLKNLNFFFCGLLVVTLSIDSYFSQNKSFQDFLKNNNILVTELKNLSNSLIYSIYVDTKEYQRVWESGDHRILDKEKSFFYSNISEYTDKVSSKKKNVVLVIVESMGYANDRSIQDFLLEPLTNTKLKEDYYIYSDFLDALQGSTVTSEFRELCGVYKNDFRNIRKKSACAPEIFNTIGYNTIAAHPFKGGYFNRRSWWPAIGFKETYFMNSIDNKEFKKCVGAYRSFCDDQFFKKILETVIETNDLFFLYYLSIEGHLPTKFPNEEDLNKCISEIKRDKSYCGNLLVNKSFIQTIVESATELGILDIDFYIVGDHSPKSLTDQNSDIHKGNEVLAISLIKK